jgi:UDP-glucose 4-epimerase
MTRALGEALTATNGTATNANCWISQTCGRNPNIVDEAPMSDYEIAEIVDVSCEPSAEPLTNPWMGHLDGSFARSLGFQPTVPTAYQVSREGAL